jgi:nitrate/TMAO reductase-like tetraheme cytochrome c subunit
MADDSTTPPKDAEKKPRIPSLFRNLTSYTGIALGISSLASILFLSVAEATAAHSSPYLGIFTYIIAPAFLVLGLIIMFIGALIERRRRKRSSTEYAAYPRIDLNNPAARQKLMIFTGITFLFLMISAVGSYKAYEHTETVSFCGETCHDVMHPEFIAYQNSPHARVTCAECHVGSGAGWYVRSKLSGAYQVYAAAFNKYPKPIPTPVQNLRPAQETCEQCHWPQKFFGAQLKVFNRYGYDETNTLRQTRMLINTGGGSPQKGAAAGIHWHMNIANEITYASSDPQRQIIPWVQMKSHDGTVEEFRLVDSKLTPAQIKAMPSRRMDCIDCHNRPSHIYRTPDEALNQSFSAGKLDISLPYLKRQGVEVLSKAYSSTDQAVRAIDSGLTTFYRTSYPDVYAGTKVAVNNAVAEIKRIYTTNFFPEMKVNWQTHPNNIGHFYNNGCFRCHDGRHVSPAGKVIRNDCNICHETLDQKEAGTAIALSQGSYEHPLDFFGGLANHACTDCHSGRGVTLPKFKHNPDVEIEGMACADCHARSTQSPHDSSRTALASP